MSTSSDDDDIRRAIALSLETNDAPKTLERVRPSGIPGLDRAAMERERLARFTKRKASVSPPAVRVKRVARANVGDDDNEEIAVLGSKEIVPPGSSAALTENPKASAPPYHASFWHGKVLKTWAFGHARLDDIKLEEVLQKNDLKLAVLSSFIWDTDWLFRKIDFSSTRVVCVMQAKDEMTKAQIRAESGSFKTLRLCFPSMEGQINCMHSKMMLLAHPGYLRIVIASGNLIPHDWGETGAMENVVFVIDLPRLPVPSDKSVMTKFGRELSRFCTALGLDASIVDSLTQFDFSATKDLAFVHTIGGAHVEEDLRDSTGFLGLGNALKDLNLASKQDRHVDFVTSSLGNINESFLSTIYHAAQGYPSLSSTAKATRSSNPSSIKMKSRSTLMVSKTQSPNPSTRSSHFDLSNFRIYFPTHTTVAASKAGTRGAGTICLSSKYYNAATFPRSCLRDCKSTREGLVMHSKIMYVRRRHSTTSPREEGSELSSGPESESDSDKDYAYVGSANLSESAWGKVVMDRKLKREKLNCRNWECGVIVPVRGRRGGQTTKDDKVRKGGSTTADDERGLVEVFQGVIPMPMQWPGEAYGDQEPWFAFD